MFDKILRSLAITIPLGIELITDAATGIPLKRNGMDIKRVDKLLPEIVSHIHHKISRFVWFLWSVGAGPPRNFRGPGEKL